MELKERMDTTVDLMKETKAEWVKTGPKSTDIAIYLHFWRGDTLVASLQCPLDRDQALEAGRIGATGFGADTMSIAFESYHTELKESPLTGKPWRHQEMQFVAETMPEAKEKGWVQECLTITMHERGGGFLLRSIPYLIKDGKVEWQDSKEITVAAGEAENQSGGGVMFDYLQDAMSQPTLWEILREKAESDDIARTMIGLVQDEEARLFHADFGTFRALEEKGLVSGIVLGAEEGSNRARWIEERLGPADRKL